MVGSVPDLIRPTQPMPPAQPDNVKSLLLVGFLSSLVAGFTVYFLTKKEEKTGETGQ